MSAHLAALLGVVLAGVGIGVYLLAQVPLLYVACGIVALVVLVAALARDAPAVP